MSVTPRRAAPEPPPKERETIQHRLARLRIEQSGKPRLFQGPSFASSSATAGPRSLYSNGIASAYKLRVDSTYDPRSGPPPPPSWRSKNDSKESLARRQVIRDSTRLVLPSTLEDDRAGAPSLLECCGRVIIGDLAREDDSILKDWVHLLPTESRQRIVDFAPRWRPLTEKGLRLLLLREEDGQDHSESEEEDKESLETAAEDPLEWEYRFKDIGTASPAHTLSRLDLSFSHITLRSLKSLLLVMTPDNPSKPSLTLPSMNTLLLADTPNIPFSPSFLDLLSILLPLRHLSLAGKDLQDPSIARPLPRLAAATLSLQSLDVSYCLGITIASIGDVNWNARWRELKRLGISQSESETLPRSGGSSLACAPPEARVNASKQGWEMIRQRSPKRAYVEVIA